VCYVANSDVSDNAGQKLGAQTAPVGVVVEALGIEVKRFYRARDRGFVPVI
jgi:hypothetical protein